MGLLEQIDAAKFFPPKAQGSDVDHAKASLAVDRPS